MPTRFDPFREVNRLMDQALGSTRPSTMPMDAYRHGQSFVMHFDLPGVDPASIELEVERNVLTVRAERSWQPMEGDEVVAAERPQGRAARQLYLGEGLDPERIDASYEHGVLTVTVPVAEKARPRRISVASGSAEQQAQPIEAHSS